MKKIEKYFNLATNLALESDMLYRHGSVVVKNGKVIGKGFNNYRSKCQNEDGRSELFPSIHAERSALRYRPMNHRLL